MMQQCAASRLGWLARRAALLSCPSRTAAAVLVPCLLCRGLFPAVASALPAQRCQHFSRFCHSALCVVPSAHLPQADHDSVHAQPEAQQHVPAARHDAHLSGDEGRRWEGGQMGGGEVQAYGQSMTVRV